jgi:cobalt-zinc-cadmium efflux system protein
MIHADTRPAASGSGRHQRRLTGTLLLTGTFLIVETVAGFVTGSLALLADAGHMLTDVGGLVLALVAIWWAAKPPTPEKTYGYYRVEILVAVANAVVLMVLSVFIVWEAYRRFLDPPELLARPMLAVAALGLVINGLGIWLLRGGAQESLNVRGAYLEVIGDALGSLGVIVAAVVVLLTGWRRADPLVAAAIGLFIVPRTWRLLREAVNVLLEGAPPHLDVRAIEQALSAAPGVRTVHDLHVWTLTSGKEAMSGHVVVGADVDGTEVVAPLNDLLRDRFGLGHTTIQVERDSPVVRRSEKDTA